MRIIQPMPTTQSPATDAAAPVRHNRFSVQRTAGSMPVWQPKAIEAANFADPAAGPKVETGVTDSQRLGFKDLIDVVNPLQHIPIVSVAYRKLTGDKISAPAQFMGGFLFGGPIGGVAAMANLAMKENTGLSFGDRAMAMIDKDMTESTPTLQLASRWKEEPRMAGYVPVWGQDNPVAVAQSTTKTFIPIGAMSSETNFAMLLNTLSDKTPNIS